MSTSEVIMIHYGQAGIQIGQDIWKNLANEAGLDENGWCIGKELKNSHDYFYEDNTSGRFSPRACFVDTERFVMDEIILQPNRLFRSEYCVSSVTQASNCFARGRYKCFKEMAENYVCTIRRMVEVCDAFAGFITYAGISGGTGSGVAAAATCLLNDMFNSKIQNHFQSVFPAENPCCTVAPLNAVLHLAQCHDAATIRWCYSNRKMFEEVKPCLESRGHGVTYQHINDVMNMVVANVSAPSRYQRMRKTMFIHPLDMAQNIVPFPALTLVSPAFVPLCVPECDIKFTERTLAAEAFVVNHELCNLDIQKGKYFTVSLNFRNCVEKEVKEATLIVRDTLDTPFVDWIPNGFVLSNLTDGNEYSLNYNWCKNTRKTLVKVSNHSSIVEGVYQPILNKFGKYMIRRAFLPWFIKEGMEEGEFHDASEVIGNIISTIQSIADSDADSDDYE